MLTDYRDTGLPKSGWANVLPCRPPNYELHNCAHYVTAYDDHYKPPYPPLPVRYLNVYGVISACVTGTSRS